MMCPYPALLMHAHRMSQAKQRFLYLPMKQTQR
jgi:hypothetical protein